MLFWLAWPATIVWAIVYYGASIGGPHSATMGMRAMDLEVRTWYGAPGYFVLGACHAVLYWVSISFLIEPAPPFNNGARPRAAASRSSESTIRLTGPMPAGETVAQKESNRCCRSRCWCCASWSSA